MPNNFRSTFTLSSLALLLMLSACSNSPTEAELKTAVERKMKMDSEAVERSIGKQAMPMKPELKAVRKIGCKGDGENASRCDIELEVNHGGTLAKGQASLRFVKGTEGWTASN